MVPDLPSDEIRSLLNRIALKDDQAIKELYLHYQRSIYAFAKYKTGDDAIAHEVVQETFLAVFKAPHQFAFNGKFSTWLCGIAKNKSFDALRKKGRYWSHHVELDDGLAEVLSSDQLDIIDRLEEEERDDILRECIEHLSQDQREAMLLAYHQGASIEEIATLQSIPQGTAKTRLFHARKKVQDCVRNAYGPGASYA